MIEDVKLNSAENRHQGRQLCSVQKDNLVIDETALLSMKHFLIDHNKSNMDKHC